MRACRAIGFPHDVEQAWIHIGLLIAAEIAEKPVQLVQDGWIIVPVDPEGRLDRFTSMGMIEADRPCIAIGFRRLRRDGKREADQKGGETGRKWQLRGPGG